MLLAELFMINTEMISGDEIPADWDDLLDEQYAGDIVIRDVEASGTMRAIYCAMIDRIYDEEDSAEPGYEWLLDLDANTAANAANPTDMYQRNRKSTRLNSSHVAISYAVSCLKKREPRH